VQREFVGRTEAPWSRTSAVLSTIEKRQTEELVLKAKRYFEDFYLEQCSCTPGEPNPARPSPELLRDATPCEYVAVRSGERLKLPGFPSFPGEYPERCWALVLR
jgi:hypothetical protein